MAQPNTWTRLNDIGQSVVDGRCARISAVGFSVGGRGYLTTGYAILYGGNRKDLWEYDPVTDGWTQRADLPGEARKEAVGFAINDKGYVCAGMGATYLQDLWAYEPATNTWVQKASLPGAARCGAVAFVTAGKAYVTTGTNGSSLQDTWAYDPVTDAWTSRAPFAGAARVYAAAFAVGGKGYVGTGANPGWTKDFWCYDPITDAWVQKADFGGSARYRAVGFALGTKGYMGTGGPGGPATPDIWEYDTATNSWLQRASGMYANSPVAFTIGNTAHLATGGNAHQDHQAFDPVANTWSPCSMFGTARCRSAAFAVGNRAYMTCGVGTRSLKDLWSYDALAGTWQQGADFGGTIREYSISFSIAGKGYMGTGFDASISNTRQDLWRYDPVLNAWSQLADLPGVARDKAVAFVISDKGYVGSGQTAGGTFLMDFWQYDPALNIWSAKAAMPRTHCRGVGFAIGNKGYAATGVPTATVGNTLDEYDPLADTWTQMASIPAATGRSGAVAFTIGSMGYIALGSSGTYLNELRRYDPVTNTWQTMAAFPGFARMEAMGCSIGGKGYLGGGISAVGAYQDFWRYNSDAFVLALTLRVLLEGPYDQAAQSMNDVLRSSQLLPSTEPFSAAGYAVTASQGVSIPGAVLVTTGSNAIVDWVLVELRNPNAPGHVITAVPALVKRNGEVVSVDGGPLAVEGFAGNYQVCVRHRNHLGVMTSAPVALSTSMVVIDFSNPATATYGTSAQKQVGSKMVMWSGDATGNGTIKYTGSTNDRDPLLIAVGSTTPNATVSNVYDRRDTNLDGVIEYTGSANDRDIILTNVGSTTPNNTRTQQLP